MNPVFSHDLSPLRLGPFYDVPLLIADGMYLHKTKNVTQKLSCQSKADFSFIVPVKDETSVDGRLLKALLKINYGKI